MADYVPTSGPWQTDPMLQSLIDQYIRATSGRPGTPQGQAYRGSGNLAANQIAQQLARYVEQNRTRLGIPPNYHPDIQTRGQTLYDPNQNQLRNALIIGAGMAAGPIVGGLLAPAGAAVPGGALPATIPGSYATSLYNAGAWGVPGATAAGLAAGTSGIPAALPGSLLPGAPPGAPAGTPPATSPATPPATPGARQTLTQYFTDPRNLINLAGLVPAILGARGGGGQDVSAQEQALLDEALKRTQRTDPLHQAATQLAFSRLPISARQGITLTGK